MNSKVEIYGIPNCNSVKKARDWLKTRGIDHEFHDFKKNGISEELIHSWLKYTDIESLINRKGTTWRALSEIQKASAKSLPKAVKLMLEKPSVIKRPVLVSQKKLILGFMPELYETLFEKA